MICSRTSDNAPVQAQHLVGVFAPIVLLTAAGALWYLAFVVVWKAFELFSNPRAVTTR